MGKGSMRENVIYGENVIYARHVIYEERRRMG
jgi:hypothetical protein